MKYFLLLLSLNVLISCGSKESQALIQDAINDKLDEAFCSQRQTKLPFADGDGTIEAPYSICNTQQFNKISQDLSNLDKYFVLKRNLDFSSETFNMIGDDTNGFTGNFDGKNYSISNIQLDQTGVSYVGMFRRINVAGVVKNLSLLSVDIIGSHYTGAVAGYSSGRIENVKVTGVLVGGNNSGGIVGRVWGVNGSDIEGIFNSSSSVSITAGQWVGGIAGWSRDANFDNNFATGNIISGNRSGGLVGVADQRVNITNSYAQGNVTGTGTMIGGLVGGIFGNVTNCYSTGDVSATNGYVGGITGLIKGTLSKSYSTSKVTLTGSYVAGGLVGYIYTGSAINNSYFAGEVSSTQDYVGGVVGYNAGSPVTHSFSVATNLVGSDPGAVQGGTELPADVSVFWDSETSGIVDDFIDDMTTKSSDQARTTAQMKTASTFIDAGYDQDIWDITDGSYPTLK